MAKNAWDIVTEKEAKPTNIEDIISWEQRETIAHFAIMLSIGDSLLSHIGATTTSPDA